jgi:pyrroloquinoline-quinone synthase
MAATTDFFQALESRIAPYDLLTHSFYRAWTAGELTANDLREYAAEYWHHVSAFPTYLSALHSRLEDAELRRTVLRNLVDEEGIDSPDRKPHSELWMDFANGMGASDDAVRQRELQPESKALIGTFFKLIQQENAAVGLAALYAYESRVPAIAAQKAAGLCDHYKADAKTCRYFTVHETADVHHAEVWKQAITKELERDPASADRALDAAETAAKALWDALDGVERLRMQRMAN